MHGSSGSRGNVCVSVTAVTCSTIDIYTATYYVPGDGACCNTSPERNIEGIVATKNRRKHQSREKETMPIGGCSLDPVKA